MPCFCREHFYSVSWTWFGVLPRHRFPSRTLLFRWFIYLLWIFHHSRFIIFIFMELHSLMYEWYTYVLLRKLTAEMFDIQLSVADKVPTTLLLYVFVRSCGNFTAVDPSLFQHCENLNNLLLYLDFHSSQASLASKSNFKII